jgi:hypothetical protein
VLGLGSLQRSPVQLCLEGCQLSLVDRYCGLFTQESGGR